jgi:hypothetical protein
MLPAKTATTIENPIPRNSECDIPLNVIIPLSASSELIPFAGPFLPHHSRRAVPVVPQLSRLRLGPWQK